MKTTIRGEQQNFIPTGGNTDEALEKNSGADFDFKYAPASGGGGNNIGNIAEQFDDFVYNDLVDTGAGTSNIVTSGNFTYGDDNAPITIPVFKSEPSHPGIVTLTTLLTGKAVLKGFFDKMDDSLNATAGLLNFADDFDINILTRIFPGIGFSFRYILEGSTSLTNVIIDDTGVTYNIGSGSVLSAVPTPGSGVWFNLRFVNVGGTLTIYLDGAIVFTGALIATDDFGITIYSNGNSSFDVDYVRTVYRQISASSGADKKVGVGAIGDTKWFNIMMPFDIKPGLSGANQKTWNDVGSGTTTPSIFICSSSDHIFINNSGQTGAFPAIATGNYLFTTPKQLIFQVPVYVSAIGGGNKGGAGICPMGGVFVNDQGTNSRGAGFVRNAAGAWFARAANNAAFTETPISIADGAHVFRMEYDPANVTPQIRYYVDGILLATVTTNLPSNGGGAVTFGAGNGTPDICFDTVVCPTFSIEL